MGNRGGGVGLIWDVWTLARAGWAGLAGLPGGKVAASVARSQQRDGLTKRYLAKAGREGGGACTS
jgi:hypothetical protein